uniref:Vascular endothelial growth factor D n=1 Tax=Cyprinus carpio TaxID=7962 RepID=A0A8C1YGL4_CYPCA
AVCNLSSNALLGISYWLAFYYGKTSHTSQTAGCLYDAIPFFSDIDDEWQKTQCMPRETCVDVAKELGTNTAVFFKPPCVSVFRCGGCCNKEGVTCRNTSVTYVNKTVSTTHCIEHSLIRRHVREKHKKRL